MEAKRERARILDMLQRIAVFGGIAEGALQHILDRASTTTVLKGECFFYENDRAQSMFVLVEGRVAVIKTIDGREYELSRLDPGDCFGELELIDFCPRAATVRALEDCRAIEITASILHEIFKIDQTSFAMIQMNMGREVTRRLRTLDAELLKVGRHAEAGRGPAAHTNSYGPCKAPSTDRKIRRCKVCTKHIQPDEEHWEVWCNDTRYVVCCPTCARHFRQRPETYVTP